MNDTERQSIIFDLDGVIIDSLEDHINAWKDEAKEHGITLSDALLHLTFGRRNDEIIPELFGVTEPKKINKIAAHKEELYRKHFSVAPKLVKGVDTYIKLLSSHDSRNTKGDRTDRCS